MNHAVEAYVGELKELREKVEVYEALLHKIQLNAEVTMNHDRMRILIGNICAWSYAHRCGNGEISEDERTCRIKFQFDRLLTTERNFGIIDSNVS